MFRYEVLLLRVQRAYLATSGTTGQYCKSIFLETAETQIRGMCTEREFALLSSRPAKNHTDIVFHWILTLVEALGIGNPATLGMIAQIEKDMEEMEMIDKEQFPFPYYQLVKVLTTPIIACIDTVLGKPMTTAQALALGFACCGIAFATVSDVQCNLRGSLLALASVLTGIVQKVLNEHMQQRSGFSTLQLMDGTRGQTGPRASATAHARAPSLLSCVATATHLAAVRPLRCARRQGDAVAFPPMMVPIPKPGPDPGPDPDPGPNPHPA